MANMSVEEAFRMAVENHQAGRAPEAENIYRQIIAQQPTHADAHYMLAAMGYEMGRAADAIPLARRAVELKPGNADFHILTGVLLATTNNIPSAIESFRQAVALRPADPSALNNLGNALRQAGQAEEAVAAYQQAILLQPDFPEVYANMSNALLDLGRTDESIEACRKAITLRPDYAGAYNDLGNALKDKGLLEEALQAYRRSIAFQPNNPDSRYNLGNALKDKGDLDEAATAFRQAINMRPGFTSAQWNLSLTLLMKGDFEAGWEAYESRWAASGAKPDRGFTQPIWDGSNLEGKSILLHSEQGFGDAIQFVRYAPQVKARGGRVSLLCLKPLQRLLSNQLSLENVVSDETQLPEFDVHCSLMSLPRMMWDPTRLGAEVPYISPDPVLAESWKRRLKDSQPALKVGLVWSGRPGDRRHNRRAMTLAQMAPLAQVPGVQFYSLQKGDPATQAKSPPAGMKLTDWTAELNDFADTAGLIANLDLIICVDTAVGHLAGAMGHPVWLLLSTSPDWRWMLNRSDTPWYPATRIFRQPKFGDWETVIKEVAQSLQAEAAKR